MHSRSSLLSIVVLSSTIALVSPTLALSPSPASPSTPPLSATSTASPGQHRTIFDLPAVTPPSVNHEASADKHLEHVDTAQLQKRWDNLCDGCAPSTGVRSFHSATKSLTDDCHKYPKARQTIVTTKKKKVFTTEGCVTTTTKKVKETMFVLWVREASFADNSPATRVLPSLLALCSAVLLGAVWLLSYR